MINKIDFKAKNLTSNAGLFLLLQHRKNEGIFDMIEKEFTSLITTEFGAGLAICYVLVGLFFIFKLKNFQSGLWSAVCETVQT